jgi:hypothetical protein
MALIYSGLLVALLTLLVGAFILSFSDNYKDTTDEREDSNVWEDKSNIGMVAKKTPLSEPLFLIGDTKLRKI